ncbi:MAG: hypothetical protein OEV48_07440, partial [Acidobacteriota bacterium]|nr:hypothetical protein [Acidobacteriota bacterium]
RYHRDISVAAPRLPQYFLVRILGLTPQAMYLSPLRGSGSHDNLSSGLDTTQFCPQMTQITPQTFEMSSA